MPMWSDTEPRPGDTDNNLLSKIAQALENCGGGGGAGVLSLSVNGGPAQTGAVSLTIPDATPSNFQNSADNADGIVLSNNGVDEILRSVGATGFVKLTTARFHRTSSSDLFAFLGSEAKSTGAFVEVYGQDHASGLGGLTVSIHDGGQFRVRSAPVSSTSSVLRLSVDGTTGNAQLLPIWNDGAVTFTGLDVNVTDTASASGSLLANIALSSVSVLALRKDGLLTLNGRLDVTTPAVASLFTTSDAGTVSSPIALALQHTTSGVPGAGFGTVLAFNLDTTTANVAFANRIQSSWSDPTHATRTSSLSFSTVVSGVVTTALQLTGAQVLVNPGTVALPSIANLNDTDTGIYFPGANLIGFATASAQIAEFSSTGLNVVDLISANRHVVRSGSIAYAASVAVDFALFGYYTLNLTGNVIFTTSNLAADREAVVRVKSDGSSRTLTFPGTWQWATTIPAALAANTVGILSLRSEAASDADVIAAWTTAP